VAVKVQHVEGVIDKAIVAPALETVLQCREIRPSVGVPANDLAVHYEIAGRDRATSAAMAGNRSVQSKPERVYWKSKRQW
jgi:hypothetical protein